jgi:hypothetical protein
MTIIHELPLLISTQNDHLAIRLVLQLALTAEERGWVRHICREKQYLRQEVHSRARPVSYVVVREAGLLLDNGTFCVEQRERVGMLVFARMQSSRCKGWYGTSSDVAQKWAKQTQWEMLALSRCWLDPRIQKKGAWHIPKAASMIMRCSLRTIGYDYLLVRPPAFIDRPFEIKEVISYCQRDRFLCMVYWFARFKLVRENEKGLRTYAHALPPLTETQRRHIMETSRLNQAAQQKRLDLLAQTYIQEVLLLKRRVQCVAA